MKPLYGNYTPLPIYFFCNFAIDKSYSHIMKKKLIFFVLCFSIFHLFSQQTEKTILFLLPFEMEEMKQASNNLFESEHDISMFPSFKMMGFWEGAKMAIDRYENPNVKLNIIVRDVSYNEEELKETLTLLSNKKIDLIIGPLYAKLFTIAAEYAQQRKVPIVNPFSTRSDFLDSNAYVYKLIPSPQKQPEILNNLLLQYDKNANIILWTNGPDDSTAVNYYKNYFTKIKRSFHTVKLSQGIPGLNTKLSKNANNMIIAFYENNARIISNLQTLSLKSDTNITIIAPESWLQYQNIDFLFFESLHLHFFSNYYVNTQDEKTELFEMDYIERYQSPPTLERFSYQGYDITSYFIELMVQNFDTSKVKFEPLSFDFDFVRVNGNGNENTKSRLISFRNYELIEIQPIPQNTPLIND